MQVVSITEDFNQEPGNAVLTIRGLPASSATPLQVAFKKPGSQDEFLGTLGWQSTPCWFGVTQQGAGQQGKGQQESIKFAMSPDLALEMEPRSYEMHLKAGSKTLTTVFHWPEIREPESAAASGPAESPANFGYISEAQDALSDGSDYEASDYDPDKINFASDDYQPASFEEEEQFAQDPAAAESAAQPEDSFEPEETFETDAFTEDQFEAEPDAADETPEAASAQDAQTAPKTTQEPAKAAQAEPTPAQQHAAAPQPAQTPPSTGAALPPNATQPAQSSPLKWLIPVIIVLILLAVIGYLLLSDKEQNATDDTAANPAPEVTPPPVVPPAKPDVARPMPKPEVQPEPEVKPEREAQPKPDVQPKPLPEPTKPRIAAPAAPVTEPDPPMITPLMATNDTYRVRPGEPVPLTVLDNDHGDSPVIAAIVQRPSHGLVTVEGGQRLIYTWLSDTLGDDQFTYQIQDAHGQTATGTVKIMAR